MLGWTDAVFDVDEVDVEIVWLIERSEIVDRSEDTTDGTGRLVTFVDGT